MPFFEMATIHVIAYKLIKQTHFWVDDTSITLKVKDLRTKELIGNRKK